MGMEYVTKDWRLFIDGSVTSLKAVLLHVSNKKPAIPLAYSTKLKESWTTLDQILKAIKYKDHKWKICCDLKVVNMLQGLKKGYPKYFCYLCCWNTVIKVIKVQVNIKNLKDFSTCCKKCKKLTFSTFGPFLTHIEG